MAESKSRRSIKFVNKRGESVDRRGNKKRSSSSSKSKSSSNSLSDAEKKRIAAEILKKEQEKAVSAVKGGLFKKKLARSSSSSSRSSSSNRNIFTDNPDIVRAEQQKKESSGLLQQSLRSVSNTTASPNVTIKERSIASKVKDFNPVLWDKHKFSIVYLGNYEKFTQSEELKNTLLNTGDTTLVEASPMDKIWGIGLAGEDIKASNRHEWKGENLLGKVLDAVRARIRCEEYQKEVRCDNSKLF